jgi:hypothetical protein
MCAYTCVLCVPVRLRSRFAPFVCSECREHVWICTRVPTRHTLMHGKMFVRMEILSLAKRRNCVHVSCMSFACRLHLSWLEDCQPTVLSLACLYAHTHSNQNALKLERILTFKHTLISHKIKDICTFQQHISSPLFSTNRRRARTQSFTHTHSKLTGMHAHTPGHASHSH